MIRRFFVCLGLLFASASTANAQELNCVIKDKNQKGIPFVNVGIPAKGFGIITEDDGNFKFKITSEKENDSILITSIGYYPLSISVADLKTTCLANSPLILTEAVYDLATTTVRPNEYQTKVLGVTDVADLECAQFSGLQPKDSASIQLYKEKGISEKSGGLEIGNKISIKKGQLTFIDKIRFKTCLGPNDTAIYRVNIYSENETIKRQLTLIGMVKVVTVINKLQQPIIVKTIGKNEVHDLDVSNQNIQVTDDFIIALECIYTSNAQMSIGAKPAMFGSTDLLFRASIMDEWVKMPLFNLTFISATVTYKKKWRK